MSNGAHSTATGGLTSPVVRSALVGAATGGRTMTAIALLAATASPGDTDLLNRNLARPPVRVALSLAAVAELIGDKLPQTPSRLSPSGLTPRLLLGGVCGAVSAARHPAPAPAALLDEQAVENRANEPYPLLRTAACAATGMVSALAGAWLGARWRSLAAPRPARQRKRAFAAALAEDAAVIGLAAAGARR
jgi:uncharacterized membrane protein